MKKWISLLAIALLAGIVLPVFSDTFHDNLDPTCSGGIVGKVIGKGKIEDVVAVEQVAYKFYQGTVDPHENTFSIKGLPPGKYDLMVKTTADFVEGFRLDIWGETEDLPVEDQKLIWDVVKVSEDFFHDKKIVRYGGTKERQKLIVEQLRTDKTVYHSGAEATNKLIRRVDYIIMRKTREVWQIEKLHNMFHEIRDKSGKGSKVTWHYNKNLGGIRVADDVVKVKDIEVPKK